MKRKVARHQFVWWGEWHGLGFHRLQPDEVMSNIYEWVMVCGPLEIRQWATGAFRYLRAESK